MFFNALNCHCGIDLGPAFRNPAQPVPSGIQLDLNIPEPPQKDTWAWINQAQKPVTVLRRIARGRNKGGFEVRYLHKVLAGGIRLYRTTVVPDLIA
jgi:hypothetical protein